MDILALTKSAHNLKRPRLSFLGNRSAASFVFLLMPLLALYGCSVPSRFDFWRTSCETNPVFPGCNPAISFADEQNKGSTTVYSISGSLGEALEISGDVVARYSYSEQKDKWLTSIDWIIPLTNPTDSEVRLRGRLCDTKDSVATVSLKYYIVDCIEVDQSFPPGEQIGIRFAKSTFSSADVSQGDSVELCFKKSPCIGTNLSYYTH